MPEIVQKEHALSAFMRGQGATRAAAPGVIVSIESGHSHVNLRLNPDDPEAVGVLGSVVSTPLPNLGQVERGEISIYWLGPQEFLLTSRSVIGRELVSVLNDAFGGHHASATDLSGGQILLALSGSAVCDFLSKASTLDFHKRAFVPNQCAQSTFAKTGALYSRRDTDVFELVIRRSFADYAARWMLHAGQEFGIVFGEQAVTT